MSENSFENSTYSENNSYDEGSSNLPESLNSPSNQAGSEDDSGLGGVYGTRLTADLLTSLPILSSATSYRSHFASKDAELSELLVRKQPKFAPQAPKCAKCSKSVYKAEETRAANKTFHKLCFKCTACNKLLEPNILTEHAGELYCKNCYAKNFGPKGYGVGLALPVADSVVASATGPNLKCTFSSAVNQTNPLPQTKSGTHINSAYNQEKRLSVSSVSGSVVIGSQENNKCTRCFKPVYAAEKVSAAGKIYHKLCYNCTSCKKLLNSMNCCDNSEGDVFCKSCYGKQYGPKGVGYGVGAGTLQAN